MNKTTYANFFGVVNVFSGASHVKCDIFFVCCENGLQVKHRVSSPSHPGFYYINTDLSLEQRTGHKSVHSRLTFLITKTNTI